MIDDLPELDNFFTDETVKKNHEFALSVIQLLSIRLRETDELLMVHAKKFRVSELYAELLSDMLSFGKKDSTGSLGLIKKEPFLERATERLNWDMKGVQSILNDLCVTTKVKMKKDSQGAEWIAVQLKNHEDPAI